MVDQIRYKPTALLIDLDIGDLNPGGGAVGLFAEGAIGLNDRITILQSISWVHTMDLSYAATPIGLGTLPWTQDGLWSLDWSIYNHTRFWKGTAPLALQLGSPGTGIWKPLEAPIALAGNETLSVRVTNRALRIAGFSVQISFNGVERTERSETVVT